MEWRKMSEYPAVPLYEDGPTVLFTDDRGDIRIGYQRIRIDEDDAPSFWDGEWPIDPVAWMPLPEPAK